MSLRKLQKGQEVMKNCTNIDFILADAEKLPLRNSVAELAIILETLKHTFHPNRVVHELARITKIHDVIILSTPFDLSSNIVLIIYLSNIKSCFIKYMHKGTIFTHLHHFGIKHLYMLLNPRLFKMFYILLIPPYFQIRAPITLLSFIYVPLRLVIKLLKRDLKVFIVAIR